MNMTGYREIDSIFPCLLSPDNRARQGVIHCCPTRRHENR